MAETKERKLPAPSVSGETKAYWDAAKGATASHPWLAGITLDGAVADGGMKLHPGALRYYGEAGIAVPDALR